jgi:hypothetical protein
MGVSKTFRNLTGSSPTLQKNIFLLAEKKPLKKLSLTVCIDVASGDHSEQAKEYKIAKLCPLLHMDRQSHLIVKERFESDDCEVAAINPRAAHANSFTQMYLTNPPCVEVCVKLITKRQQYPERDFLSEKQSQQPTTPSLPSAGFATTRA